MDSGLPAPDFSGSAFAWMLIVVGVLFLQISAFQYPTFILPAIISILSGLYVGYRDWKINTQHKTVLIKEREEAIKQSDTEPEGDEQYLENEKLPRSKIEQVVEDMEDNDESE